MALAWPTSWDSLGAHLVINNLHHFSVGIIFHHHCFSNSSNLFKIKKRSSQFLPTGIRGKRTPPWSITSCCLVLGHHRFEMYIIWSDMDISTFCHRPCFGITPQRTWLQHDAIDCSNDCLSRFASSKDCVLDHPQEFSFSSNAHSAYP